MPRFQDRPLSWLFLAATVCIDLAAWATGHYEDEWIETLVVGQTIVLGVWLAIGGSHRLARAGVSVAAVLALAAPDYWTVRYQYLPLVHVSVVTSLVILAGASAAIAGLLGLVLRKRDGYQKPRQSAWRFSIVELLGWMIVVAAVALVARNLNSQAVGLPGAFDLALVAIAAALATIWRIRRFAVRGRVAVTVLLTGVVLGVCGAYDTPHNLALIAVSYGYVALWVIVQNMDEARLAKIAPAVETTS